MRDVSLATRPSRKQNGMDNLFQIIHEDSELLVINKPAGLVCHPTKTDAYSSLISRVRLHLGAAAYSRFFAEPSLGSSREGNRSSAAVGLLHSLGAVGGGASGGAAEPHLINRLDRETSGIVVVAKTGEAARRLRRAWEGRAVHKEYLAIVHGHVRSEHGLIDAPLGKNDQSGVAIKDCVRADGVASQTAFHVERRFTRAEGDFTLLRVIPHTGRKHQIRVHLAHYGHSIVGDKLYGGDEELYLDFVKNRLTEDQRRHLVLPFQALHAETVRFPWRGGEAVFCAEPERWFAEFASRSSASSKPIQPIEDAFKNNDEER